MRWGLRLLVIFLILSIKSWSQANDTWQKVLREGKGEITVYFSDSEPFIMKDQSGNLTGIEYEIFEAFVAHVSHRYNILLKVNYVSCDDFTSTYNYVKNGQGGVFAISSFSITEPRKQEIQFSPPYIPDIEVLICSENIPLVMTLDEFKQAFKNAKALNEVGTTFENNLLTLKEHYFPNMVIENVGSTQIMRERISKEPNLFGYAELPSYLLALKKGLKLQRQYLFSIQREGYSIIFAKNSDWARPINDFFKTPRFKPFVNQTLQKYLGEDVQELLWTASAENNPNEITLLTQEKEIQRMILARNELELARKQLLIYIGIGGAILAILIALYIFHRYRTKIKINELLEAKNNEIQQQQDMIIQQNKLLAQQNQVLEDLNEEKDGLMSVVAHDLKSPLNKVKGLISIVELTGELNEDQHECTEMIKKICDSGTKLIQDLLDVNAIEFQESVIKIRELEFVSWFKNLLNNYASQSNQKNISIHYSSALNEIVIASDESYLLRIMDNLITNAIKFSYPNQKVEIDIQTNDTHLIVSIKDEGQGFSEEDKQNLFKKFHKLSAQPTGGESSTGLGLSIVKALTDKLYGDIKVESELNKGATVIVILPKIHPVES